MKWFRERFRVLAVFALFVSAAAAHGQVAEEQAWRTLVPNPQLSEYTATAVGADAAGSTYTLQNFQGQLTDTSIPWMVTVTDQYGNPIPSRMVQGVGQAAFGMAVDYYGYNFFVLSAENAGGYSLSGYLNNGFQFSNNLPSLTPLSLSVDYSDGEVSVAYQSDGTFTVSNYSEEGFSSNNGVSDSTLNATYAVGDQFGNTFASGTAAGGKVVAKLYNSIGAVQWTRSFTNTQTTAYSIGPFAEDPYGNSYMVVNEQSGEAQRFVIFGIDGATDTLYQTGKGNISLLTVADSKHIYVAGEGVSGPFLSQYSPSGLQWSIDQAAQAMACPRDGSNSVLISAYEPAYRDVIAHKYNSAGVSEYAFYWQANSMACVAPNIQWVMNDKLYPSVFVAGTTTSTNPPSVLTIKYLEGPALESATFTSPVIGGQPLKGAITLTEKPAPYNYQVSVNSVHIGLNGVLVSPDSTSAAFSFPTSGVDSPTTESAYASDARGAYVRGTITILPAQLNGLSGSALSVTPDASLTGTVWLNGLAGPSGTVIDLSSDTPLLVVPAIVTVPGNEPETTFKITTRAVESNTIAHITAKHGTVTDTISITLVPPVLAVFSASETTVIGGNKVNVQAWLNGEPAKPVSVSLTSSNPSILPTPATLTIPANASNGTATLTSSNVTNNTPVTITAKYGSVTKTTIITIKP